MSAAVGGAVSCGLFGVFRFWPPSFLRRNYVGFSALITSSLKLKYGIFS